MAIELLAIVQAEQQAEALIKEANARKDALLKQALAEREFKLRNLRAPEIRQPQLRPIDPKLDLLRKAAARNKGKAVRLILEELHAA